jgi:phosphatidylglycerophosphate synthase
MFDRMGRKLTAPFIHGIALRVPPRITPSTITGFGLLAGIACAVSASRGWIVASIAFWTVNRLADGIDGALARINATKAKPGLQTDDLGGYFDLVADFLIYAIVPIGIAWTVDNRGTWIALSLLLSVFYVNLGSWSILSAIQEKRGRGSANTEESTTITMPSAIIEGAETIAAYAVFLLFPSTTDVLFVVFALLVAISAGQRVLWAKRNL